MSWIITIGVCDHKHGTSAVFHVHARRRGPESVGRVRSRAMPDDRRYFEELREQTFAKALADGLEIVIPTSRQLQLDIDRPWPAHFSVTRTAVLSHIRKIVHGGNAKLISLLYRFEEEFPIVRREAWKSAGGNCHVLLSLFRSDLDPTTRIALQSMLGSDPMRELLNLRRVLCGADDPIALFRPTQIATTDRDTPDYLAPVSACPTCGEPQFECPSGLTCKNGHGY